MLFHVYLAITTQVLQHLFTSVDNLSVLAFLHQADLKLKKYYQVYGHSSNALQSKTMARLSPQLV